MTYDNVKIFQEHMLFCDSCDLGYHMNCHLPPVPSKPPGKWICYRCQDASTVRAITRSSRSQSADAKNGNYNLTKLLGIIITFF